MKLSIDKFQIKQLGKKDILLFKELIKLFHEVFEMENVASAKNSYLKTLFKNPGFIVYVAMRNNKIVGGITAYELPLYYSQSSELFIYDIAVLPKYQRKGIGEKLLLSLNEYCKHNGIKEMFVAANEEDKHALDFYKSTGGKAEKVMHFNYNNNSLKARNNAFPL